jgi:hypothetical protein
VCCDTFLTFEHLDCGFVVSLWRLVVISLCNVGGQTDRVEFLGKPVTTSVPSISIKFHANAEQLEELYGSDDEHPTSESAVGSSGSQGKEL